MKIDIRKENYKTRDRISTYNSSLTFRETNKYDIENEKDKSYFMP